MKRFMGLVALVCGLAGYPCLSFSEMTFSDIFVAPRAYTDFFGGYIGGDGDTATSTFVDWSIGNTVPFHSNITNDMVFSTSTGDFMEPTNWKERMRVTKEGNVGIGATSPDERLEVAGNIEVSGAGNGVKFPDGMLQTTASAPTWHQILPALERFQLVMNNEAVLDRETGLVWEKSPDATTGIWTTACSNCYRKQVSGRRGWRLPAIEELATLVDSSQSEPALPEGHPFIDAKSHYYWSSTPDAGNASKAWLVNFGLGHVMSTTDKSTQHYVWCVRGGNR